MKKIFFSLVLFFVFFSSGFAQDFSVSEKSNLQKQVIKLQKQLDTYILKQNIEAQKTIVKKVEERLSDILKNNLPEKNKYILKQILHIYSAKNDYFSEKNIYKVMRVIDGDTIEVNNEEGTFQVRFIGVDTPERGDCYYSDASKNLSDKILGKNIILVGDTSQSEIDIFQRKLRYVFLENGEFVNSWIISQGFGNEYTYKTQYKFQDYFKNLQEIASYQKKGKWSDNLICDDIEEESQDVGEDNENNTLTPKTENQNNGFYTSAHYTSKLYYCANDSDWEGLSKSYLEFFNTEKELLEKYSYKTLNKPCN